MLVSPMVDFLQFICYTTRKDLNMYEERIAKLEKLHQKLDKKIAGKESTGVYDDFEMYQLKKEKLQLRDEIETLKYRTAEHYANK